jgi:hypothetical protein
MKRSVVSIDLRSYAKRLQLVILGTTQVSDRAVMSPLPAAPIFL